MTNHAVLRGPATGHIDVPELGRIAVHARNVGGAVDVDVTADRPDARAVLRGHVGAMTVDLRQADVPLARLTVDRREAASGHSLGSSPSFRDGDTSARDSSRDNQQPTDRDDEPIATDTSATRRVRIVL